MLHNIFKVFKNPNSFLVWCIFFFATLLSWYMYSDVDYVSANYQSFFFGYFDIALSWVVIIFLPLLIAGITYRSVSFGVIRSVSDRPTGFLGIISGIVSILITGAACCGVTLISLLGLTSIISFFDILPYHGIEVKILGVLLLLYAFWDLYRNIDVCKRRK